MVLVRVNFWNSYRKRDRYKKLVIKSQSGGNGGGGSVLTKKAIDLIWKYRSMEAQVQEQTEKIFALYFKEESE